jgi:cholesterol transport system auxiliary component
MAPLIAEAIEQRGGVRAVAQAPALADLRLDIELVRLLHDFTARPSRVRLTVRAQLVDAASRRIVATREFDEVEEAVTEDAYGGVVAASHALGRLLERLADYVAEHAEKP